MSEPSLLCLQNDLLCCMKEGKELFRCDESKRLDNIQLQSHPVPTRISEESWAACVAAMCQKRLEAWCLCRPTGVLCQPRPDPTRGHARSSSRGRRHPPSAVLRPLPRPVRWSDLSPAAASPHCGHPWSPSLS